MSRVVALESIRRIDTETGESYERAFCLETDLPALEKAILSLSDCRLVVIDPITAFLGRTDSHKNAELRGLLAPLSALAARHKVAVVAISHLNKNAGVAAVYRTMGSIAFVAAARAAHVVVRDEADKKRRLFLAVKSNLAEEVDGLAYSIVGSPGDTKIAMVEWESEPVTMSADEALSVAAGAGGPDTPERDAAADWLRLALGDGEVPAKEVMRQAKENAIAIKTLRRAATEIGVKIHKEGFQGEWKWSLCDEDGQAQKQGASSSKMATASPPPSKMVKHTPVRKGRASLDNGGHLWTLPSKDGGDAGSQGAKDGQPLGIARIIHPVCELFDENLVTPFLTSGSVHDVQFSPKTHCFSRRKALSQKWLDHARRWRVGTGRSPAMNNPG